MAISLITDPRDRAQVGKAINISFGTNTTSNTTTSGAATSGSLAIQLLFNNIGTTSSGLSPVQSLATWNSGITDALRLLDAQLSIGSTRAAFLVRLYKIGAVNLTTSSSEFTHDAATFPVLRTRYGQSSQPVSLIPLIVITTALTTTAAQFTVNYVDQSGNSVTGATTFVMPSATTALSSCFTLPIEADDIAIRDISDIVITTTSATGAADIYGAEILTNISAVIGANSNRNTLVKGFTLPDLQPAVATSGTATSQLAILTAGVTGAGVGYGRIKAYRDN